MGENTSAPGGTEAEGDQEIVIQDLNFTSAVPRASPQLMLACASGKHIASAVLTARQAGRAQAEFQIITLEDFLVSSYQTAAAAGERTGRLNLNQLLPDPGEVQRGEADGSLNPPVTFCLDVKRNGPI